MHGSQRRTVRREGMQRMEKRAPPGFSIERTRAEHLLCRPRQIDLRGVLGEHDNPLCSDALPRGIAMRLQDVGESRLLVLEEAIGRHHFSSPATSGRNARGRMLRQRRQHSLEADIQPLVIQIGGLHLIHDPRCQHDNPSLTRFAPPRFLLPAHDPRTSPERQ